MTQSHPPSGLTLGLAGFRYADLHEPTRLRDLYDVFAREAEADDPDLWRQWDAYRRDPGAARPATEISLLLVRMAPLVSRFIGKLFGVEAELRALAAGTHALDEIFRFKADFVRRRVLPLLKSGHLILQPTQGY